ncbi:MAG: carbohydrate ABC transporter permease [Chloroflexota bacterium]|nr:carbohydrate ABC transporter permease [Chloroflexota bacterium]
MSSTNTSPSPRGRRRLDMGELAMQIFLFSVGLAISLPIIIAAFTSFKAPQEVITYPPKFFPSEWTLRNYEVAFSAVPFARFLLNSFIQSSLITVGQVLFSVLAAFALATLDFPGREAIFFIIIGSLMIPFELTFIPNFQFVTGLGWANAYSGLTIPFLASAFGVFLLRQFFLSIPRDLHDASLIDGASNWRYLWTIVVPLSKGAIGAFAIFAFLSAWNQYLWPLVITDTVEMRTIQIGIRFFMTNIERGADWGAVMAGSIIALLPTLAAFLVAQKQLVKGIAMTGLKG